MEIEKNLVVSTGHMTREDSELLSRAAKHPSASLPIVDESDFWYLVHIGSGTEMFSDCSEALQKLVKFACEHEEGFTNIKFDRDGDELEGFEVFDW